MKKISLLLLGVLIINGSLSAQLIEEATTSKIDTQMLAIALHKLTPQELEDVAKKLASIEAFGLEATAHDEFSTVELNRDDLEKVITNKGLFMRAEESRIGQIIASIISVLAVYHFAQTVSPNFTKDHKAGLNEVLKTIIATIFGERLKNDTKAVFGATLQFLRETI